MEIGLGQMGMTNEDFWNSSPREFFNRQKGFYDLQTTREREAWRRMRMLACINLQPYVKKGDSLTPDKLLPFEWERPEVKIMSADEMKGLLDQYKNGKPTGKTL